MSTTYSLPKQLANGEKHEKELDEYYNQWFEIAQVSRNAQRLGIDRVWTGRNMGYKYTVEYKADTAADRTGNIFIETMSVDTQNIMGWAYTSCAQRMVFYIPPLGKAYHITTMTLKYLVQEWVKVYGPPILIPNKGYNTMGVPVPIGEFARYCFQVDDIRPEKE
jgi:hypothetical protein